MIFIIIHYSNAQNFTKLHEGKKEAHVLSTSTVYGDDYKVILVQISSGASYGKYFKTTNY